MGMRRAGTAAVRSRPKSFVTEEDFAVAMAGIAIAFTRAMRISLSEKLLQNYTAELVVLAEALEEGPARAMMTGVAAHLKDTSPAH